VQIIIEFYVSTNFRLLLTISCTLNLSFKKYQYSPGLQAGDDEPGGLASLLRRPLDGGAGRGVVSFYLSPVKAGAIQYRANFLNQLLRVHNISKYYAPILVCPKFQVLLTCNRIRFDQLKVSAKIMPGQT
jgi:hypothetical protein